MNNDDPYAVHAIGYVRSSLQSTDKAPRQGNEGAPDAWVVIESAYVSALAGINRGDRIVLITFLHRADRTTLQTHPRNDPRIPLTGVFATRSPDRPNPLGLHMVEVREVEGIRLRVGPIEAIDGTPVVDIKPVLPHEA
jgi:tRNA-Thr(GGU) m(6)t(6)A37 methyltransferase TsaA